MAKTPLYPDQVPIDKQKIELLTQTYKQAYVDIVREINGATNFGVANRKAILGQIEDILQDLAVDINEFINEELPGYYKVGADDAVKQLNNVGADVGVSEGFNRVHEEAISALVDDTGRAFAESIRGVGRSAQLLLGKATRNLLTQRMAKGIIAGEALAQVRREIKGILQEEGLASLVDKGGRKWTLERYGEMLFRTKAAEARNRGMANRMVENGYDLLQVSSHMGACEMCRPWEGKILSLTGKTKGYPTVAQAERSGLFHPNCKHAMNALIPSLAKRTRAYDPTTKTYGPPGDTLTRPVVERVTDLLDKALNYDQTFKNKVEGIASEMGLEFSHGPVKKPARAAEKIVNDYDAEIAQLKDMNRSVLFVTDPKQIEKLMTVVKKEFDIDRLKDDLSSNFVGYKKAMINVQLPHGVGEIQVTTREYWRAKKELGGDELYHQVRIKTSGWEALEKKMNKLYQDAEDALTARLNSS